MKNIVNGKICVKGFKVSKFFRTNVFDSHGFYTELIFALTMFSI